MNEGQVTLKDIAERLGLSISTVSRALKDHPDISMVTKKKVQHLAGKLEYEPNRLALNLLKKQSNLIAVIIPKLTYYLYTMVISGIEEIVEKEGYHLMICQTNESHKKEVELLKEINATRPAGYLISLASESYTYEHLRQLQRKDVPLVIFNRDCAEIKASKVIIDNREAAKNAVLHLHEQGYRNIAFLAGPENVQISNQRIEGYKMALDQLGRSFRPEFVRHTRFNKEDAANEALSLIDSVDRPDAIIAFSDQLAVTVILTIKNKGFSVPDDIAVMGFNNEPSDELMEPALTSIDQPAREMGQKAAEMLLAQIKGHKTVREEILKSILIPRKSTVRLESSS